MSDKTQDYFDKEINEILREKLKGDNIDDTTNSQWKPFISDLQQALGWGYSKLDITTDGNYAIFMQHGKWFNILQNLIDEDRKKINFISSLDSNKLDKSSVFKTDNSLFSSSGHRSAVNLSQRISDIQIPEISKEYLSISTRQRNSFVNTREVIGSDININWIESHELGIIKYHEAWTKAITLIKDGKIYIPDNYSNDYLIENPYANNVWICIFKPHTYDIQALICIMGVFPINLPLNDLMGNRGQSKLLNLKINYKMMDIKYAFYDGWGKVTTSSKGKDSKDSKISLANNFMDFLNISISGKVDSSNNNNM